MVPRSTQRRAQGPTQDHRSSSVEQRSRLKHPPQTPDIRARKSRRIARRVGDAGPSGWKHAGEGHEWDLVPPSDVEEYEEWERCRATEIVRYEEDSWGTQSTMEMSNLDARSTSGPSGRMMRTVRTPVAGASPVNSAATSPTIPLESSQTRSPLYIPRSIRRPRRRSRAPEAEDPADDEEEDNDRKPWRPLVSPGGSSRRRFHSSPISFTDEAEDGMGVDSPLLGRADEMIGGEVLPDEYEPPPMDLDYGVDPHLDSVPMRYPLTPDNGEDNASSDETMDIAETNRPLYKRTRRTSAVDTESPNDSPHVDTDAVHPMSPSLVVAQLPSTSPVRIGTPPQSDRLHGFKASSYPTEDVPLTPSPDVHSGAAATPKLKSPIDTSASPLMEAQLGPHNVPHWRSSQASPVLLAASTPHMGRATALSDTPFASVTRPSVSPLFSPEKTTPIPRSDVFGHGLQSRRSPANGPTADMARHSPAEIAPRAPPTDPALERFQTSRTFRTRTKLQLQPYTKERQIYEAALRRGGLKNGKRAIARERDISPSEEDNEPEGQDESASEAEISPEAIVIGNTPPEPKRREPVAVVDADYDEYFMQYGEAPRDDDIPAMEKLQKIARARVKSLREEAKRRRREKRAARKFERLIKAGPGPAGDVADSDSTLSPGPVQRTVARPAKHTPGRTKTYSKKDRNRSAPPSSSRAGRSAQKGRVQSSRSPSARVPLESVVMPDSPLDDPRTHLPSMPVRMRCGADGAERAEVREQEKIASTSDGVQVDFGLDMDYGYHGDSFFVDDLPPPDTRRERQDPESSQSGSSSDSSAKRKDVRRRIAGRMMPAFMLKRLEREAAEKERRRQDKKRREAGRSASPARPGRAVVRRKGTNVNGEDLLDFVRSEGESSDSVAPIAGRKSRSPTPAPLRQRELIVISDESAGGWSSSSQAQEDYTAAQSLARLYDGDFETIVNGARPRISRDGRTGRGKGNGRKVKRDRRRRPLLGLVNRFHALDHHKVNTPAPKSKQLPQARLDFPLREKPPNSNVKTSFAKKRKRPPATKARRRGHRSDRPAIRLDDHVIFSNADFAFDDEDDDVQFVPATSLTRISGHTPRKSSAPQVDPNSARKSANHAEHLDAGVGKARSWANFDKFPVDFGISPLPSGLYCNPDSYIGNGSLRRLVDSMSGRHVVLPDPEPTSTYGVELRDDMAPAAIASVLPVLCDGIKHAAMSYANSVSPDPPSNQALSFLQAYIAKRTGDVSGDMTTLRSACAQATADLTRQLDGIVLNGKPSASIRQALLAIRIGLLQLACRATEKKHIPDPSAVQVCGIGLMEQLLGFGIDRAIRPLKKILKGESESAEVDDEMAMAWIAALHVLKSWSIAMERPAEAFLPCLEKAFDSHYPAEEMGPIAAERVWYLIFGLCALSQFENNGRISAVFNPEPRWSLVKRAVGLIRISHNEEIEERAQIGQLQGRDRYIKTVIARCVRLSAVWKWSFDRASFSVATKDLGVIFKDRLHRNLPTEPPVDYPDFIVKYDMGQTAADDTRHETAYEMYLRLVCVAASDLIGSAQSLNEAQQAEKDVQRLIMSIIPVSPVKFNRILPPTAKQLGQLINRYSTTIAACYFSPSLLSWLLANSQKWIVFGQADFESRQVVIRGLMYLAVVCRHHDLPSALQQVVDALADVLSVLQTELDEVGRPSRLAQAPSRVEIERTMVLVVVCFRQIIGHHTFDPESRSVPVYPDACLLHESWTGRIFALDLQNDTKCGIEVVNTIQAFLDARSTALPALAKQRREARIQGLESQDEYSFGIDFSAVDLAALGGEADVEDPVQKQDDQFANIITTIISPRIYRLLSDMLPLLPDETISEAARVQRQVLINRLTKCWSDCAAVLVIEPRNSSDGWTPYVGAFGRESWQRFRNERGRLQVGLQFMTNVAILDPGCYSQHDDTFLDLFFQCIVADKVTIEHKFVTALFRMHHVLDTPIFADVALLPGVKEEYGRTRFMEEREGILDAVFRAIPTTLRSEHTSASVKSRLYRYINLLVSAMSNNAKTIPALRVIHTESYHAFTTAVASSISRHAGEFMNTTSVPGLREFV